MGKKSKKQSNTSATAPTTSNGGSNAIPGPSNTGNVKSNTTTEAENVVPMEVSDQEYQDLVAMAAELSENEAKIEWLECARYGEVDAIRALVNRFPSLLDHVDDKSGNTALHMCAANGHVSVAKLLLSRNHAHKRNLAGNTPLHWAASNGQTLMVEYLTKQEKESIDVLEKNEFGRSALTEGFTSQQEDVVKALLEHDSASEEKLLSTSGGGGGNKNGTQSTGDNGDEDDNTPTSIVHSLFDKENPLKIRELAMANADNPFADVDRPDQDTTGFSIWSASLVLAQWMKTKSIWNDASVLELGAGCGVPGLAVAMAKPHPRHVYVTDLNPQTVDNVKHNIALNNLENLSSAIRIDWEDKSTWPSESLDYVIGSDLIYQSSLVPLLVSVIMDLLKPGGTFFYVAPDTGRDGLDDFVQEMKQRCPHWKGHVAPMDYHKNPLTSGDDEECFLHFQELSSLTYILHEFQVPIE